MTVRRYISGPKGDPGPQGAAGPQGDPGADLTDEVDALEAAVAALPDQYAPLGSTGGDPLWRWHEKLRNDPTTAKLLLVGDSTSLRQTNQHSYLDTYYANSGGLLDGIPAVDGGGNNGSSLAVWYATRGGSVVATGGPGFPSGDGFNYPAVIAADPDLIVLSFGLNDVRLGGTTLEAFTTLLRSVVVSLQADLPDADILLRMPNSLVGTPNAFLTPATTAAAQTYSTLLRNAYLALESDYSNLAVADTQMNVFGTQSYDTSIFMQDQLHPNSLGYSTTVDYLVEELIAVPETYSRRIQPRRVPATPSLAPRETAYSGATFVRYGTVGAAGSGFFDLSNGVSNVDASDAGRWALATSDRLYIDGIEAPVSLTSATVIDQLTTGTTRVYMSGDHSAYAGKRFVALGAHAGEGVQEGRFKATVDPASVPANSSATQTVTVTGAIVGQGVICAPGNTLSGLGYWARVSAANTVTLTFVNPTGSAIDAASSTWQFWLAR